ncbi:MAG: hypothetical protein L0216_18410 [Planctomycetales bacterium]|nr:hypothetical protein [Planctomycetales bacterium]
MAAFKLRLNLPHAGTVALRIEHFVQRGMRSGSDAEAALLADVHALTNLLLPVRDAGENPEGPEGARIAGEAATIARRIVDAIEKLAIGHDRLGQAVRNLFECLELGEEGAKLSLRAGENPESLLRP